MWIRRYADEDPENLPSINYLSERAYRTWRASISWEEARLLVAEGIRLSYPHRNTQEGRPHAPYRDAHRPPISTHTASAPPPVFRPTSIHKTGRARNFVTSDIDRDAAYPPNHRRPPFAKPSSYP